MSDRYNRFDEGDEDWGEPADENFGDIGADIDALEDEKVSDEHDGAIGARSFYSRTQPTGMPFTRGNFHGGATTPFYPEHEDDEEIVVVFQFDDQYQSQYDFRGLFTAHDIPVELAINVDHMDQFYNNHERLTWNELEELVYEEGWRVLNHGYSHEDLGVDDYELVRFEIYENHRVLAMRGFEPEYMIWAHGSNSMIARSVASQLYGYAFSASGGAILTAWESPYPRPEGVNPFAIDRLWLENEGRSISGIETQLDHAVDNNSSIIIYGHHVIDGDVDDEGYVEISTEKIEAIIDYVTDSDDMVWGTTHDAMARTPTVIDVGDPNLANLRLNHQAGSLDINFVEGNSVRFCSGTNGWEWDTLFSIDEETRLVTGDENRTVYVSEGGSIPDEADDGDIVLTPVAEEGE